MYSDNVTQKVAEVAAKIMAEQLKGNQKKIDKNHNNKIDGQDFAILRGEKKVEEAAKPDFLDLDKDGNKKESMKKASSQMKKEEVEQIEEMDKSQDPPGRDGGPQFPPGPKVSKKVIKAINKDPAKHLSDLFTKEYSKKKVKEEVEQIDELKKCTLQSYYKKSVDRADDLGQKHKEAEINRMTGGKQDTPDEYKKRHI